VTGERIGAAYDTIAAEYAERTGRMLPEHLELGRDFLAPVPPPARLLEVGCGAGRDMAWFESQGANVVGVDLSPGMLRQARGRVRGELLEMDMLGLGFPDGSFEGVWCMATLLHLPKADAPRALGEMRRVLAPGGALALSLQRGEGEMWETVAYGHRVERFFARYSADEAERLLGAAGFGVVLRRETGPGAERPDRKGGLFFLSLVEPSRLSVSTAHPP
jgi:ubiquinone/menaquinone biosynthesis C-methylase UbiE